MIAWKATPKGLLLPSSFNGITLDSGVLIPCQLPPCLIEGLNRLVHPLDEDEWHRSVLQSNSLKLRAFVAYEFLLRRFGIPIPGWKLQIASQDASHLIDALCYLWIKTWNTLEWLHQRHYIGLPAVDLCCLIAEMVLLTPNLAHREDGEGRGASALIAEMQKQNRTLEAMDTREGNPFSYKRYPHTHRIVANALAIASMNHEFYRNLWRPVIKARMRLATVLKGQKPKSFDINGVMEMRGTRSKVRKNVLPLGRRRKSGL